METEKNFLEDPFLLEGFYGFRWKSETKGHPSNWILDIPPEKVRIKTTLRATYRVRYIISNRCFFSGKLTNTRHKKDFLEKYRKRNTT